MEKYFKKNNKKNKGFVILYSVIISSIILAITLSITNISLKEIKFGTSAKSTNEAFFAADTGAECALANDKSDSTSFVETDGSGTVTCLGGDISLISNYPIFSFILSGLGSSGDGCAKVVVNKNNPSETSVISKGYNIGDENCLSSNPNRVERQIELNY